MSDSTNSNIIYPSIKEAAAAVCQRWVDIHKVIEIEHTKAQRVRIKHYSIALSIALLPDGCIAPPNHPEI